MKILNLKQPGTCNYGCYIINTDENYQSKLLSKVSDTTLIIHPLSFTACYFITSLLSAAPPENLKRKISSFPLNEISGCKQATLSL
jgi:hypothetical protein